MSKSNRLHPADVRAAFRLKGECRELGDDPAGWQRHWASGLARLAGADVAVQGEVDRIRRARSDGRGMVVWPAEDEPAFRRWLDAMAALRIDPDGASGFARWLAWLQAGGGVLTRRGLLADPEWYRSPEYEAAFRPVGVDHPLFAFAPVPGSPDDAFGGGLAREHGRPDFGPREVAVAREALAAVSPLVGGPLTRLGEPSPAELPPRTRQVLRALLDGASDKETATRLGISPYTVDEHVRRVFAHFGVQTRMELLAKWVRRLGGPFAWADAPS